MSDEIRIVVADDHQILRDGLVALLDALPGKTVVGTAGDGREAVRVVAETHPDVVVMDIQMPHLDGLAATRQIMDRDASVRIVMLTMNEDDDTILSALRAGARGYLLKGADSTEVVRAIEAAAAGGTVFGASLATRIADFFAASPVRREVAFPDLTERERTILELLAAGRSNTEIARQTYLSDKTVRNNISGIYAKLHAADRAEAMIKARDAGMGRDA